MSEDYIVTASSSIDAEEMLKKINSLSDLLKIEFISDADNILLLRRGLELVINELGRLSKIRSGVV